MNYIKTISWFLGISIFMTGFLKFFNPFKEWYTVQILQSGLGEIAYVMGILGELFVGITLISALVMMNKISLKSFSIAVAGASILIAVIMLAGTFVHLHPSVPGEVLPLKIKPPFIPAFFLLLALINTYLVIKELRFAG